MNGYIEIIGPCSKWVEGKGWVTKVPFELIEKIIIDKQKIVIDKIQEINDIRVSEGLPPISTQEQIEAIERYNLMGSRRRP